MQAVLPEIRGLGASLVVLCPQTQDFTRPGAEKQGLGFPILSDPASAVGAAYGLAFDLPEDLIKVYQGFGNDLPKVNGDGLWRLSMPARIVIRKDGIIASAEADPDYTHRPEVEETLAILRNL